MGLWLIELCVGKYTKNNMMEQFFSDVNLYVKIVNLIYTLR